jgi:tetratricopeptide (TPR) repeat protein
MRCCQHRPGTSRTRVVPCVSSLLPMVATFLVTSCGTPAGTGKPEAQSAPSKEALYQRGHLLYASGKFDSAAVLLRDAIALDSSYVDALQDLGMLCYDRAMQENPARGASRTRELREARRYLAHVEQLGTTDAAVYERLCEISVALDDDRSFLLYARKDAERFPFDRQYYNLGLACFNAGEYREVVNYQKTAIEIFPHSPFLGGYYRQMGRAYMKQDRDQTAQRVLETGLAAVDDLLAGQRQTTSWTAENLRRLSDDRVAILQLLRRLYQTYRFEQKLKDTERLLGEAGAQR